MKKNITQILLVFFYLIATATSCEEEIEPIPCSATGVSIRHWDNAGQAPQTPSEGKIKKEAYLLEVAITTDSEYYGDSYRTQPILEDPIKKVSLYTLNRLNEEYPAALEITTCFKEYPLYMKNKINDYTLRKQEIDYVKPQCSLFKALFALPEVGTHQFRVVLTLASGATLEAESEPIELY